MKWHEEAVPKQCLELANQLRKFSWLSDFYLAGGTALTLYYGHRISVDLDFFSSTNKLNLNDREKILRDLAPLKIKIEQQNDGTLNLLYKNTHLSFFVFPYPALKKMSPWTGIKMAHPLDIGLMKLSAILGRSTKKDFFDLYKILSEGYSLRELLRLGKKKFKMHTDFQLQVCQAMLYFEEAEKSSEPKMIDKTSWFQVRYFFEKEVRLVLKFLE